ncbi:anti-sigma factor [Gracilibacillus sp. YIM 98692]|uniref:anti-sigma factor n=1 Tax=Gracilibacillus sp. YIM 98692 TaxID=2663532 RepID=UPI0013D02E14|nr:anti-sigma factor [Gracilibacillus sp. YIM 98692]
MVQKHHLTEEAIIDYIEGNSGERANRQVKQHMDHCETCHELYQFWKETLEHDEALAPTPELKKNLDKAIKHKSQKKKRLSIVPKPLVTIGSIVIVFVFIMGLYDIVQNRTYQPSGYEILQNEEIQSDDLFVNSSYVEEHELNSNREYDNVDGKVWVNSQTDEVLLEVEGLTSLETNDHQLWIMDKNDRMEGELLIVEDGVTRVLYRFDDLSQYKLLKGSIEPLGGSQQPTGPATFFVHFE